MIINMKKLLAIVVLGLLLISCAQQNRDDEYSCLIDDKSGSQLVRITNDRIIEKDFTYPIKEETKDKIYGVLFENQKHETNITFYKRTKKLKLIYLVDGEKIFLYDCTQLN